MILGVGIQIMNQLSGINLTSYVFLLLSCALKPTQEKQPANIQLLLPIRTYMSYIFIHSLNFSELNARILAAAGSMDYLLFACAAYYTIEYFGRRKVMMTSSAACCTCWVIITIVLSISDTGRGDPYKLGSVAVTFFFVFFAAFGMGILGVTW